MANVLAFVELPGAAFVLLHECLDLRDLGAIGRSARKVADFQRESWLLWQRLFIREAPRDAAKLLEKTKEKQSVLIWRGAVLGHAKRAKSQRGKYGAQELQRIQKALIMVHPNAPKYLACVVAKFARASVEEIESAGPLLPPPPSIAAALEEAWQQLDPPALPALRQIGFHELMKRGVPWNGKWSSSRGFLEFLAITCAPNSLVDAIFSEVDIGSTADLAAALFEAARCHRQHLLNRVLEVSPRELVAAESRLLALACYSKNLAGVRLLLSHGARADDLCPESLTFPTDDVLAGSSQDPPPRSPLAAAVLGRGSFPPAFWANSTSIVETLLEAGAGPTTDALPALLGQPPFADGRQQVSSDATGDDAWRSCFSALASLGSPLPALPLHAAASPVSLARLLEPDSGLPPEAVGQRNADGVSATAFCAVRAARSGDMAWRPAVLRLLQSPGAAAALEELLDVSVFLHRRGWTLDHIAAAEVTPCPVLWAAIRWKDATLLKRSLTQSAIDSYGEFSKVCLQSRNYSFQWESFIYHIALGGGAAAIMDAIDRGLRFDRTDVLRLHDETTTHLGPVAALCIAASCNPRLGGDFWICEHCGAAHPRPKEAEADGMLLLVCEECGQSTDFDESGRFGEAAVRLLELGLDTPDELLRVNGAPGSLAELDALRNDYIGDLPEFFEKLQAFYRER